MPGEITPDAFMQGSAAAASPVSLRLPTGELTPDSFIGGLEESESTSTKYDTSLTPSDENRFGLWKRRYASNDSGEDYDLRGAFKAGLKPDPKTGHWPDKFKKPNHPTFSVESQYAKDAPEKAGHWEGDKYIPADQKVPGTGMTAQQMRELPGAALTRPNVKRVSYETALPAQWFVAPALKIGQSFDSGVLGMGAAAEPIGQFIHSKLGKADMVGQGLQNLGRQIRTWKDAVDDLPDPITERYAGKNLDTNPELWKDGSYMAHTVASAIGSLGSFLIPGRIAEGAAVEGAAAVLPKLMTAKPILAKIAGSLAGTAAGTALESMVNASDNFAEARERYGADDEDALRVFGETLKRDIPVTSVTNLLGLYAPGTNKLFAKLLHGGFSVGLEGYQEVAQGDAAQEAMRDLLGDRVPADRGGRVEDFIGGSGSAVVTELLQALLPGKQRGAVAEPAAQPDAAAYSEIPIAEPIPAPVAAAERPSARAKAPLDGVRTAETGLEAQKGLYEAALAHVRERGSADAKELKRALTERGIGIDSGQAIGLIAQLKRAGSVDAKGKYVEPAPVAVEEEPTNGDEQQQLSEPGRPVEERPAVEAGTEAQVETEEKVKPATKSVDPVYEEAVGVIRETGKASASVLQRRLRIGYGRASRLLDAMQQEGVVGPPDGLRPREILNSADALQRTAADSQATSEEPTQLKRQKKNLAPAKDEPVRYAGENGEERIREANGSDYPATWSGTTSGRTVQSAAPEGPAQAEPVAPGLSAKTVAPEGSESPRATPRVRRSAGTPLPASSANREQGGTSPDLIGGAVSTAHKASVEPGAVRSTPKLPAELAGAKPRYSYGSKQFELDFASDLDKAAYVAAQLKRSKSDSKYVAFVGEHLNANERAVRSLGLQVRSRIKEMAAATPAGGRLQVEPVLQARAPLPPAPSSRTSSGGRTVAADSVLSRVPNPPAAGAVPTAPPSDRTRASGSRTASADRSATPAPVDTNAPSLDSKLSKARATLEGVEAKFAKRAETARANLKKRGNMSGTRLNSGIDPEDVKDMSVIAAHHFVSGPKTFRSWSTRMVEDIGDRVKPLLMKLYRAGQQLAKGAGYVFSPVGTRVAGRDGGKPVMNAIEQARIEGRRSAGERVAVLNDLQLAKLPREDRFHLVDVIEGRAKAGSAEEQRRVDTTRAVFRGIAKQAEELGVQSKREVTIKPEDPRPLALTLKQHDMLDQGKTVKAHIRKPFAARQEYFPHRIMSPDRLAPGQLGRKNQLREDVAANLVRLGEQGAKKTGAGTETWWGAASMEDAYRLIDSYIEFDGEKTDNPARLIEYLVNNGQAADNAEARQLLEAWRRAEQTPREGAIEFSRQVNLPFWDPDPARVLPWAATTQSIRLEQIRELGQDDELIEEMLGAIADAKDEKFVRKWVDLILHRTRTEADIVDKAVDFLKAWQTAKLGFAGVKNVGQGALNTALGGDVQAAIAGLRGLRSAEGRRFALESGATLDDALDDALESTGVSAGKLKPWFKWNGLTKTEQWNRTIAAVGGADYAQRLIERGLKGDRHARRRLAKLLGGDKAADSAIARGKLTTTEVLAAAQRFTDRTQFSARTEDTPAFASGKTRVGVLGPLVWQFKNFGYQQARLVWDETVNEARAGNYGRAAGTSLMIAGVYPLWGLLLSTLLDAVKGKRDRKKEDDLLSKWGAALFDSGALGVVEDVSRGAENDFQLQKLLEGAAIGETHEFSRLLFRLRDADTTSERKNARNALGRWLVKQGPWGQMYAARLFPYANETK